jgi:hypothetical protein
MLIFLTRPATFFVADFFDNGPFPSDAIQVDGLMWAGKSAIRLSWQNKPNAKSNGTISDLSQLT